MEIKRKITSENQEMFETMQPTNLYKVHGRVFKNKDTARIFARQKSIDLDKSIEILDATTDVSICKIDGRDLDLAVDIDNKVDRLTIEWNSLAALYRYRNKFGDSEYFISDYTNDKIEQEFVSHNYVDALRIYNNFLQTAEVYKRLHKS